MAGELKRNKEHFPKQFIGEDNLREHILIKHENQQQTKHSDDYEVCQV